MSFFISESEKPDNDNEFVGRTGKTIHSQNLDKLFTFHNTFSKCSPKINIDKFEFLNKSE